MLSTSVVAFGIALTIFIVLGIASIAYAGVMFVGGSPTWKLWLLIGTAVFVALFAMTL